MGRADMGRIESGHSDLSRADLGRTESGRADLRRAESPDLGYEFWDVIVVGAGPAGCAAAAAVLQADPGVRLLLLDRAEFPRDKPCGDGIAAEALSALRGLGFDLDAALTGTEPLARLTVRSPGGATVSRPMRQAVRVVPRRQFDAALVADLAARGVRVRRHTVRQIRRDADGTVVLDGRLAATVVIGADGAESAMRRAVHQNRAIRPGTVALAIRGYAPVPAGLDRVQLIAMTERHWPAYAWSFPIGNGYANVGYGEVLRATSLNRADLVSGLQRLLPELDTEPEGLRAHRLPLSSGRPPVPTGPVLLVGDAQSMINPFTGEGIFYAVTTGMLAGQAAVGAVRGGGDAGRAYRSALRRRLGRHLRHTTALARLGRSPALLDAGVRAAAADQRSFDDLVRFGLSDGRLTARLLANLRWRD